MTSGCRYTVVPSIGLEALLDRALAGIAADIEAAAPPVCLRAVVLGGGYGRGEGGVRRTEQGDRPYNDLDFFVFTSGADNSAQTEIARMLNGIARKWEKELGIAVDFSCPKETGSLKRVASKLMYQELLRGWVPVWGRPELERWIPALEPEALPVTEAVRLLLNRGMGLMLAGECLRDGSGDADFIVRNMHKAALGSGDALLIAGKEYRWRGAERTEAFAAFARREGLPAEYADLYEQAFRYKLEPEPVMPERPLDKWRERRVFFLNAVRRIAGVAAAASARETAAGLSRLARGERSFRDLLRWLRRTYRIRWGSGMFDAPVVTVLGKLYAEISASDMPAGCPPGLRRLWEAFN